MPLHEAFGEVLASLEHSSCLRRTDDWDVLQLGIVLEVVIDAFHQRVFRTNHHHLYPVPQHKHLDAIEVIDLDVDVFADGGCACIARSNVQFLTLDALTYFPGQRMFAPAAA